MRVALASDHAGFELKQRLAVHLREGGWGVDDLGPASDDRIDYPDQALQVALAVRSGRVGAGVLVCGTGIGMSMAANKVAGVRAAVVTDEFTARAARAHNDANVICLGARVIGVGVAAAALDAFLATDFEGGRHAARIAKINALDAPVAG